MAFGYNPAGQLIQFKFAKDFYQAPQQAMSRFWNHCDMEMYSAIQQFTPIFPQIDGIDSDVPRTVGGAAAISPKTAIDSKAFSMPGFIEFDIKQVGVKYRSHSMGHAVERTNLWTLTIDYRRVLAGMFASSVARFRDRVLLVNSDAERIVNDAWSATQIASKTEAFPGENKYYIATGGSGAPVDGYLDLETLMYMNTSFKNDELLHMGERPLCVASIWQVQNLLNEDKVQNADYNTIKALVEGHVNSYMGFKFLMTKMAQTTPATGTLSFVKTAGDFSRSDVANAGGSGYSVSLNDKERIVFCYPRQAFGCGYVPQSGFVHTWQDPYRGLSFNFMIQEVVGWRRKQDEFLRVAYAKKAGKPGVAPRREPKMQRGFYTNFSQSGMDWNFGSAGKTAA